jgi:hypothetical protein
MGGKFRDNVRTTKLFRKTHRWLKRWVFCFPSPGRQSNRNRHDDMNRPPIPHDPAPATLHPNGRTARDVINALGRIYLDAGLPLAVAFEAAMADYQCHFEPQELCLA